MNNTDVVIDTRRFVYRKMQYTVDVLGRGVVVYNDVYDRVFELPQDPGDVVLKNIIDIQSNAFDSGITHGKWLKADEIRNALNVAEAVR